MVKSSKTLGCQIFFLIKTCFCNYLTQVTNSVTNTFFSSLRPGGPNLGRRALSLTHMQHIWITFPCDPELKHLKWQHHGWLKGKRIDYIFFLSTSPMMKFKPALTYTEDSFLASNATKATLVFQVCGFLLISATSNCLGCFHRSHVKDYSTFIPLFSVVSIHPFSRWSQS